MQRRSPPTLAASPQTWRCTAAAARYWLSPLGLEAIEAYLSARLGDGARGAQLRETARVLLERTGESDSPPHTRLGLNHGTRPAGLGRRHHRLEPDGGGRHEQRQNRPKPPGA